MTTPVVQSTVVTIIMTIIIGRHPDHHRPTIVIGSGDVLDLLAAADFANLFNAAVGKSSIHSRELNFFVYMEI